MCEKVFITPSLWKTVLLDIEFKEDDFNLNNINMSFYSLFDCIYTYSSIGYVSLPTPPSFSFKIVLLSFFLQFKYNMSIFCYLFCLVFSEIPWYMAWGSIICLVKLLAIITSNMSSFLFSLFSFSGFSYLCHTFWNYPTVFGYFVMLLFLFFFHSFFFPHISVWEVPINMSSHSLIVNLTASSLLMFPWSASLHLY